MTEKERYATIGTWVEVFREEGVEVSYQTVSRRLDKAAIVGETARLKIGRVVKAGFYAESDVRGLLSDRLQGLPRAGEDGTFEIDGEIYGTMKSLSRILGISDSTVERRVHRHSLQSIRGQDKGGEILDFYPLSGVRSLCADLLQELPQANENDLIEKDGKIFGTIPGLAKLLGISVSGTRSKIQKDSFVTIRGKDKNGHLRDFYLLVDVRKACFELLNPFDSPYFAAPDNIKHDLLAFASQLGKDKSPLNLNTGNISALTITCQNGRVMKGGTYLRRAAVALGLAVNDEEAGSKLAQALRSLLKISGFEIFDKDYFQNSENLKADLTAYASLLNRERSVSDLTAGSIASLSIVCHNGLVMKGAAYLRHAAVALGFASDYNESLAMNPQTLKFLIKSAGFEVLDADYFRNPNQLRGDFAALAAQLGEDSSPLDLNAKNILALSIVCGNGQPMLGETYLHSAAKALSMAKDVKEASGKKAEVLKYLLGLADLRPFDRSYFQNPDNMRADLSAFASRLGANNIPSQLNTHNIRPLAITCANGQLMRGYTYLNRASRALGLARNKREAKSKWRETLRRLKEIAGLLPQSPQSDD